MAIKLNILCLAICLVSLQSCKTTGKSNIKDDNGSQEPPVGPKLCQTTSDIKTHLGNKSRDPEGFCLHKIENPAARLSDGSEIPASNQIKKDLELAFLNTARNFDQTQSACAKLGAGWHAPLSLRPKAAPRAISNTESLEAIGQYFSGLSGGYYFWSSSSQSNAPDYAYGVDFSNGNVSNNEKAKRYFVLCLKS